MLGAEQKQVFFDWLSAVRRLLGPDERMQLIYLISVGSHRLTRPSPLNSSSARSPS